MDRDFAFGADPSIQDPRTISYEPTLGVLYTKDGYHYLPEEHLHQHKVGICTAIHLVQERQKANNKKYSADFQYLLQKKFYDGNWNEGSSILNALKVGKKYGFLPENLWTHTVESDRSLPYVEYINKLRSIPEAEINRLLTLCIDKIPGYSQVDVNNPTDMARAIYESKAGILSRFVVGSEWWIDPINPLRPPQQVVSGHAIIMSEFDYTAGVKQILANTWGQTWANQGNADINWMTYRPTEAWVVTNKVYFLKDLKLGMTDPDVKLLQKFLNSHTFPVADTGPGSMGNETEYFGEKTLKAVKKFQIANNIQPPAGYVGIITRTKINATP